MFVPEYDVKHNRVDNASYDVLYKKYTDAYNRAVKNARRYDKNYDPNKPLKTRKQFIERIITHANDPEIAAKYKADKKGIAFLATELGKKDARKFQKGQAKAYLKNKGIKEEDITIHMLTKTMYTTDNIWEQIKLRYNNLRGEGKSSIQAKLIISSEFFGSD